MGVITLEEYLKRKKKEQKDITVNSLSGKTELSAKELQEDFARINKTKVSNPTFNSDIAPIAEQKSDKSTWFQKGAFENGVNIKNTAKAILGTVTDINEDLTAGILGMGEKVVDTGAYIAGLLGNDEFKDKMSGFIAKDLYDEEKMSKSRLNVMRGLPVVCWILLNLLKMVMNAKS